MGKRHDQKGAPSSNVVKPVETDDDRKWSNVMKPVARGGTLSHACSFHDSSRIRDLAMGWRQHV